MLKLSMHKNFFLFSFLALLICVPAYSLTLNGGIQYSVESARIESFSGVPKNIDMKLYSEHLKDINYVKNQKALLTGNLKYSNIRLQKFSNNTYSVTYTKNKKISFFYNSKGHLEYIDLILESNYPKKIAAYDINGNLDSIIFSVSQNEQYAFDTNKQLIAHWIKNNGYNEQGELVMTRE